MANEIVKFNNQFNNVALKGFTSQELNLLITIASKLKEKEGEKVTFDFFDLKKYIKLNKNFFVKEKSQIKSDFKDTWLRRHNPQPRKCRRKEWIGEKE